MATKQKPKRDVVSEILDPTRHSLGDLGVALVDAARRASGIDRLSEPDAGTQSDPRPTEAV